MKAHTQTQREGGWVGGREGECNAKMQEREGKEEEEKGEAEREEREGAS